MMIDRKCSFPDHPDHSREHDRAGVHRSEPDVQRQTARRPGPLCGPLHDGLGHLQQRSLGPDAEGQGRVCRHRVQIPLHHQSFVLRLIFPLSAKAQIKPF